MKRHGIPEVLIRLMKRTDPAISEDLFEEFELYIIPNHSRPAARIWLWSHALRNAARGLFTRSKPAPSPAHTRDGLMSSLFQDFRYGIRLLLRTPMTSAIAVVTIGIGVGLSTHTFSFVWGSTLRPLPIPGSDRLARIDWLSPDGDLGMVHAADFRAVQASSTSFEDIAGYTFGTANIASEGLPPERYQGAWVTDNLLSHIGIEPKVGRTLRVGDGLPNSEPVVVLSDRIWRQRFESDESIVGTLITVNGVERTIVGVMSDGFNFPFNEDMWLPAIVSRDPERGTRNFLTVVGRLNKGVSLEQASSELSTIAARIAEDHPETNRDESALARPYSEGYMPREIVAVNVLMLAAVVAVLLIACANVANLLLARALSRAREVALRTALGAGRGRILRQMVAEASVVSMLGGTVGLGIATFANSTLNNFLVGIQKPYWIDVRLDLATMAAAIAATTVAAMLAGLLPAWRALKMNTADQLKAGGRGASDQRLGRATTLMVTGQIALSTAILVGATLMFKSVANFRDVDLGFEAAGVFTARLGITTANYPEPEDRLAFYRQLSDDILGIPDVAQVALTSHQPGLSATDERFSIGGVEYEGNSRPLAWVYSVTPGFFDILQVPLLEGRHFDATDGYENQKVAIVSESFSRRFLEGDAIGRTVLLAGYEPRIVVGVVTDTYVGSGVGGIGDDKKVPDQIYLPYEQMAYGFMNVLVTTHSGESTAITGAVRNAVANLDANTPIYRNGDLRHLIDQSAWAFKLFGTTFGIYGLVSLFMAAVGLFGVMEFNVRRRNREVGIRLALGASAIQVLRSVSMHGLVQLAVGLIAGLGLGALGAKPLAYILYGVDTGEIGVYGLITITLALFGSAACLIPASRALRLEPSQVLRDD